MKKLLSVCVCAFLLFTIPASRAADVTVWINEIAWMGTAVSANHEWMELFNFGPEQVSLAGWMLRADDGTPAIALSGEISGYGYYLLERTSDDTVPGITADKIYTGALGNDNEALGLYDASGERVDYVDRWHGGNNETKETMQRRPDGSWCTAIGTPGSMNTCPEMVMDVPEEPEESMEEEEIEGEDDENEDVQGVIEEATASVLPVMQIVEVHPNGPSVEGDYVEIVCVSCDSGVRLSDIVINGKKVDSDDMLLTGERLVAYFGKVEIISGWVDGSAERYYQARLSTVGISGTQGEVELKLAGQPVDAVCWNPQGIEDLSDKDQQSLRDRGLWEGSCLASGILTPTIVLARMDDQWTIDHRTPGTENSFLNQPPIASIAIQGSGLHEGVENFSFNVTGTGSSDPDGDPLRYMWDFGNGQTSEKPDPVSVTYAAGSYTVLLTVTDPFGATSQVMQKVEVRPKQSPISSSSVVYVTPPPQITHDLSDFIIINEFIPNPKGVDAESEFIELKNNDTRVVDLTGWKVRSGVTYTIRDQIEPGGFLVLPAYMTKIALKNSGSTVVLLDPTGRVMQEVVYDKAPEGKSYARKPDGSFAWMSPTPGEENSFFDEARYSRGAVARVVDGDTLEVNFDGELLKVRLIGIDAPETKHPLKEVQTLGAEAAALLSQLALGKTITLEFDEEKYDTYDRLLAYVYVGDLMLNLEMLRSGLAGLYDRYPFSRLPEFQKAAGPVPSKSADTVEAAVDAVPEHVPEPSDDLTQTEPPDYIGLVRFHSVFANPKGSDDGKEYLMLENISDTDISLDKWKLVIGTKKHALPAIAIPAGGQWKLTQADVRFTLRNSDLAMELHDNAGNVIDMFFWQGAIKDDQLIMTGAAYQPMLAPSASTASSSPSSSGSSQSAAASKVFMPQFDHFIHENVVFSDISKLSRGVIGVEDEEGCFSLFFDTKKYPLFLMELISKQKQRLIIEMECFGNTCMLSGFHPYQ